MRPLHRGPNAIAALAALFVGCALPPAHTDRQALVLGVLAQDNERVAARDPDMLAGKYLRMQATPVDWMRGTAALYWRDLTSAGAWAWPTAMGDGPSSRVQLLGDPHPENLGSFRAADGTVFVDWNDFDAAGFGPYWGDLRRWALACVIDVGASGARAEAIARAAALAYASEIERPTTMSLSTSDHPLVAELRDDAVDDGAARDVLERYAPVDDATGLRRLVRGELGVDVPAGLFDDALRDVTRDERVLVRDLLDAWTRRAAIASDAPHVLDVVRRLGAGVASYPALRFYVLLAGPSAAPDDDLLLELKEAGDGVRIAGLPWLAAPPWASGSARVIDAQQAMSSQRDGDALRGSAAVGTASYRSRERTSYQQNLDLTALQELEVTDANAVDDLAALGARMLARAHAGARTADDLAGQDAIAPVLRGKAAGLADETAAFVVAYAAQLRGDRADAADLDLLAETMP